MLKKFGETNKKRRSVNESNSTFLTDPESIRIYLMTSDIVGGEISDIPGKTGTYISTDGVVDVTRSVVVFDKEMRQLPFQFGKVTGDFIVNGCGLTSLFGAPREVGRDFNVANNKLTNLQGCPRKVPGIFNISNNRITSLDGAPEVVGDDFYADDNLLTNLQGFPRSVAGDITLRNNRLNDTRQKYKVKSTGQIGMMVSKTDLTSDTVYAYYLEDVDGNTLWNGNMQGWSPEQLQGVFERKGGKQAKKRINESSDFGDRLQELPNVAKRLNLKLTVDLANPVMINVADASGDTDDFEQFQSIPM